MRSITQPGPPAAERIQWVAARGRSFSFTLEAGLPLLEAARRGFAAEGFSGGVLNVASGALAPFAYVMPALSKTGANAAFYSDTFRPDGVTRLTTATMTLGARDGAPFFHCHGLWTEADGRAGGGHILPEETIVAEPFQMDAFGIDGAVFAAEFDPETNFAGALEGFCRERGIARAKIRGGVGSTIGARFTDGRIVEPFATELTVTAGGIAPTADGALAAELDVALVDYTGGLAEGRLTRGDNPVLMTMELVLEVLA
jgi:predicted DNA-binding protein with PD1-like motif